MAIQRSLRARILNWLMVLFATLLVFGTIVAYIAAVDFANRPYDRELIETALALGKLAAEQGNLSGIALTEEVNRRMTRDDADRMVFKVTGADGRIVGGDPAIPTPAPTELSAAPQFEDIQLAGEPLRLCTLTVELGSNPGSRYVVAQVAEALTKRRRLTHQIFVTIAVPQLLLTVLASFGLWLGLGSGLAPLVRLKQAVGSRSAEDLRPLSIDEDTPDEVRPLIEAFNEVLARMRRLLASQQRFVADAAHQLRTPLAGVKTQAELALRLQDREAIHDSLRQVLMGAERGSALIGQLLTLARHDEGQLNVPMRWVDLNEVARSAATKHVQSALGKSIDLGFESSAHPVYVRGDPISIEEMIANVIDNAVRYTHQGGRVTSRVASDAGAATVVVEDDGPGIPPEDRERVFERFYRRLGTAEEGSGLGLAIVAEIARRHGAQISVGAGANGCGATFSIRFPEERGWAAAPPAGPWTAVRPSPSPDPLEDAPGSTPARAR